MDFPHTPMKLKAEHQPWKITMLVILLIVVGCAKLYRAIWFAIEWETILTIGQPTIWWFILNTSIVSAFVSFLVGWWLWSGSQLAGKAYWIWFILLSVLYWIEKLALPESSTARTGWLFDLGMQGLFWIISFWILKPKSSAYLPAKEKSDV